MIQPNLIAIYILPLARVCSVCRIMHIDRMATNPKFGSDILAVEHAKNISEMSNCLALGWLVIALREGRLIMV
jgi:hypothetical protein